MMGRMSSNTGNKFIFVAVDNFTKWIETKVVLNKTDDNIKKYIENLIVKKARNSSDDNFRRRTGI